MDRTEEFNHVMISEYLHLKPGDPVKVIEWTRDSGYPVYVVEDAKGNVCKPLCTDVAEIADVHGRLARHRELVEEYEAIVDRLSNKLMDIKES